MLKVVCLLLAGMLWLAAPNRGWCESGRELAKRGQELLVNNQPEAALEALLAAKAAEPRSEWIMSLLGRTYFKLGRYELASANFREAAKANPADSYSRMMLEQISQWPDKSVQAKSEPKSKQARDAALKAEARLRKAWEDDAKPKGELCLVLDPARGGREGGALSGQGLAEKDLTLKLALKMKESFDSKQGQAKLALLREADYFLPGSARLAGAGVTGADLYVSLQISFASKLKAPRAYVLRPGSESALESLPDEVRRENPGEGREARAEGPEDYREFVLREVWAARNQAQSAKAAEQVLKALEASGYFKDNKIFASRFDNLLKAQGAALAVHLVLPELWGEKELAESGFWDKAPQILAQALSAGLDAAGEAASVSEQ